MLSLALEYAQKPAMFGLTFYHAHHQFVPGLGGEGKKIPRSVYLRRLIERDMEETASTASNHSLTISKTTTQSTHPMRYDEPMKRFERQSGQVA